MPTSSHTAVLLLRSIYLWHTHTVHTIKSSHFSASVSSVVAVKTAQTEYFSQRAPQLHPHRVGQIPVFNSSINTEGTSLFNERLACDWFLHSSFKNVQTVAFKLAVSVGAWSRLMCAVALPHAAAESYFTDFYESVKSNCEETTLCQHPRKQLINRELLTF